MHSRRAVLTTAAAAAAACAAGTVPAAAASPVAARPTAAARDRMRRLIARMTPEEKAGQLFVMRVYGHSATDPDPADVDANRKEIGVANAAELIAKYHVGGVIYFSWAHNTRDPHQIAELSNGIQRAGAAQRLPVPPLISTDQEHGIVARIGAPATLLPGAMALGAGGSRADATTAARISGAELYAMGIRQDFAPDADVNVNPANPIIGVRSFGSDPQAVARMVTAQVRGYQGAGVAACAKHFPGHGDTDVDSHVGLPTIHHTAEEWERLDEPPFRAAVAAGIDVIMSAHIVVPAFDPSGDPATLSHPILTGLLRERLGYDGVVITDSLGMQGVREKYGDERVPVLALKAGVDQLLNPPDLAVAHAAVVRALKDGELPEADIDAKLLRILLLKERRGLFADPYTSRAEVDRVVGVRRHLETADALADRTTTLLRNTGGVLPLSRRREHRLLVAGADAAAPSGTGGPPTGVLARELTGLGFAATALSTGMTPDRAMIDEVVASLGEHDAAVVATYDVTPGSAQRALVEALLATGKPVVQLAVRNPYDIAQLDGVRAGLASYGWTDVEVRAAARVIAGRRSPRGRLPVPVMRVDAPDEELYPVGHGLTY
ncbi:glycoside hydrolase family 3 protein [Streptomyces benahoarensis]|uniref:beta-N-acetylhexosaminidase n=1 Tax=Streptomyces benahoarensis TaxID=2595054 RepID=A0A553ZFV0_9ACTN|nr:glycoside hydrolase family 3 protein [Streptomyces benahoarensis]TSB32042.1 glycoside hydrolase family 3 protein [Streptomyces benahoarensis]TSB40299.1 glycoside hydrolase family 3 protein [Streptomyces benahoarensis]